jgi:hypothetical protein
MAISRFGVASVATRVGRVLMAALDRAEADIRQRPDGWLYARPEGVSQLPPWSWLAAAAPPDQPPVENMERDATLRAFLLGCAGQRAAEEIRAWLATDSGLATRYRHVAFGQGPDESGEYPFYASPWRWRWPLNAWQELADFPAPHLGHGARFRIEGGPDRTWRVWQGDVIVALGEGDRILCPEDGLAGGNGRLVFRLMSSASPASDGAEVLKEMSRAARQIARAEDASRAGPLLAELVEAFASGPADGAIAMAVDALKKGVEIDSYYQEILVAFWRARVDLEAAAAVVDDGDLDLRMVQVDCALEKARIGLAMAMVPQWCLAIDEVDEEVVNPSVDSWWGHATHGEWSESRSSVRLRKALLGLRGDDSFVAGSLIEQPPFDE